MRFAYLTRDEGNHSVRQVLLQMLLGLIALTGGTCVAWADEKSKSSVNKPVEYVRDTFEAGGKSIRVWRFDPKAEGKQPVVLLLPGADGGESAHDMYCGAAKRLAEKGFVVFLVHNLDATKVDDDGKASELVKRVLRGTAT